jgi:hypothetical protein
MSIEAINANKVMTFLNMRVSGQNLAMGVQYENTGVGPVCGDLVSSSGQFAALSVQRSNALFPGLDIVGGFAARIPDKLEKYTCGRLQNHKSRGELLRCPVIAQGVYQKKNPSLRKGPDYLAEREGFEPSIQV